MEAVAASGGDGKRRRASGSDTEGKGCPGGGGGRAERAAYRRYAIVSLTIFHDFMALIINQQPHNDWIRNFI